MPNIPKLNSLTVISNKIVEKLTSMISTQMYVSQHVDIRTSSMAASFVKNNVSLMSPTKTIQDIQIKLSSYCDLLSASSSSSGSNCNTNQIITEKVKLFIFNQCLKIHYLNSFFIVIDLNDVHGFDWKQWR